MNKLQEDPYLSGVSSDSAKVVAETAGWDIVTPLNNELFIDIDNEQDLKHFHKNLNLFTNNICEFISGYKQTPSKSGIKGKCHIVIYLIKDIAPMERILYQLLLGSDRTRETLSLIRLLNDDPIPTLFFEKKK